MLRADGKTPPSPLSEVPGGLGLLTPSTVSAAMASQQKSDTDAAALPAEAEGENTASSPTPVDAEPDQEDAPSQPIVAEPETEPEAATGPGPGLEIKPGEQSADATAGTNENESLESNATEPVVDVSPETSQDNKQPGSRQALQTGSDLQIEPQAQRQSSPEVQPEASAAANDTQAQAQEPAPAGVAFASLVATPAATVTNVDMLSPLALEGVPLSDDSMRRTEPPTTLETLLEHFRAQVPPEVVQRLTSHTQPIAAFNALSDAAPRRVSMLGRPQPRLVFECVSALRWLLGVDTERAIELLNLDDLSDLSSLIAGSKWERRVRLFEWCLDQYECALCGTLPQEQVERADQIFAQLVGHRWRCDHIKGSELFHKFQSVGGVKSIKVAFSGAMMGPFPTSAVVLDDVPSDWRDSDQFCVIPWKELCTGGTGQAIELLTVLKTEIELGALVPELVQMARTFCLRDVSHFDSSYCLESFSSIPPALPPDGLTLSPFGRRPAGSPTIAGRSDQGCVPRGSGAAAKIGRPQVMTAEACSKRLSLVLDIDHTLLVVGDSVMPGQPLTPAQTTTSRGLFARRSRSSSMTGCNTFVRPGLAKFIKTVAAHYNLYIATAATGPHPFKTVELLEQLCNTHWSDYFVRCVDRDEFQSQGCYEKSLAVVLGTEETEQAIVIDDKVGAWRPEDRAQVIAVEPLNYQSKDCRRDIKFFKSETKRIMRQLVAIAERHQKDPGIDIAALLASYHAARQQGFK